jgi:hypothetical protein
MLLAICLKAALSKLDPEVSREVARAMNGVLDIPDQPGLDIIKVAASDLLTRVLPNEMLVELEQAMSR